MLELSSSIILISRRTSFHILCWLLFSLLEVCLGCFAHILQFTRQLIVHTQRQLIQLLEYIVQMIMASPVMKVEVVNWEKLISMFFSWSFVVPLFTSLFGLLSETMTWKVNFKSGKLSSSHFSLLLRIRNVTLLFKVLRTASLTQH